ncbi:MAG: TrkA family potassium uptake protein [Acidobacteria bacterium]|nr:TrkA family potassium uptake protein [Acidobacteriota bacterium]
MKQVCIIGLGRFGSHLAKSLAQKNCEVIVIDADEERVNEIRDYVHHALIADAKNFNELKSVISPEIDEVVIAFGGSLDSSILSALHLKKLGVKMIRAKAFDEDHAHILKLLGVDEVVFPENDTAERLAARMMMPNYLDFLPITEDYRVVELAVPEHFYGKTLAELQLRNKFNVLVLGVKNKKTKEVRFMPGANFELKDNHILVVVGQTDDLDNLSKSTSE